MRWAAEASGLIHDGRRSCPTDNCCPLNRIGNFSSIYWSFCQWCGDEDYQSCVQPAAWCGLLLPYPRPCRGANEYTNTSQLLQSLNWFVLTKPEIPLVVEDSNWTTCTFILCHSMVESVWGHSSDIHSLRWHWEVLEKWWSPSSNHHQASTSPRWSSENQKAENWNSDHSRCNGSVCQSHVQAGRWWCTKSCCLPTA